MTADIVVSLDVHAALVGARHGLLVDIIVAGQQVGTWAFTIAENRAVRGLRIPAALVTRSIESERRLLVRVELRPRDVTVLTKLDPSATERRPLGVALHRVKQARFVALP